MATLTIDRPDTPVQSFDLPPESRPQVTVRDAQAALRPNTPDVAEQAGWQVLVEARAFMARFIIPVSAAVLDVMTLGLRTPYEDIDPLDPEWLWPGHFARAECRSSPVTAASARLPDRRPGSPGDARRPVPRPDRGQPARSRHHDHARGQPADIMRAAAQGRRRRARHGPRPDRDRAGPFEIPADLPVLRAAIDEIGDVAMVVIDPLPPCRHQPVTAHRVRQQIMRPLQRLARDTGVAIVVVHHTVKSGAIAGSKTITDAARSVMTVSLDEEDNRVRVLEVTKSNIACKAGGAVRYVVDGEWPATQVVYLPESASVVTEGGDAR